MEKVAEKVALITGITGQDGSYLAELLLAKGYAVHGMIRDPQAASIARIAHLGQSIQLHVADLLDQRSLIRLLERVGPQEVYNLAAQTFVPLSWQYPVMTADATGLGVARLLEAIRAVNPQIRFYQAGSSEMFGHAATSPQNEATAFCPQNPYAAAKVYGHWMTVSYRETYGIFACSGILFNHESPRRPETFVTRKITAAAARIKLGLADQLRLGNLDSVRDWGFAADYVRAMWLTLQQEKPTDYVIGTGRLHRVRDFVETAFAYLGLDWRKYVVVDPRFYRPCEPYELRADASRAATELSWAPETPFEDMVRMMVDADLAALCASDAGRAAAQTTARRAVA